MRIGPRAKVYTYYVHTHIRDNKADTAHSWSVTDTYKHTHMIPPSESHANALGNYIHVTMHAYMHIHVYMNVYTQVGPLMSGAVYILVWWGRPTYNLNRCPNLEVGMWGLFLMGWHSKNNYHYYVVDQPHPAYPTIYLLIIYFLPQVSSRSDQITS